MFAACGFETGRAQAEAPTESSRTISVPTDAVSPPAGVPATLSRLLTAGEGTDHDQAWAEFVAAHSGILLHTCRSVARDRDAAMDGYAFVLESLHEARCRRLRTYTPDGRTRFTTWLVVVTRRILLDHFRSRYGRTRSSDETHRAAHESRRRLEDLVAAELDSETVRASESSSPDASLRHRELTDALTRAIAALEPADRLLIALRFTDDRPVRDIASTLGLPTIFHVYRRLGSVLAALRRALAERGVDAPDP